MDERRLEYLPLHGLRPDPRNPKGHAAELLDQSLARFGFTEPVMIDERTGLLVAGHGRRERLLAQHAAASERPDGLTEDDAGEWYLPVVRGWASKDDEEAYAYLLASNRLTELGGWNARQLWTLLDRLAQDPAKLLGTGHDAASVEQLQAGLLDTDDMVDAVARERSMGERKDTYAAKGTRSLVLDYEADEHRRVIELAAQARIALDLPDVAAVFRTLAERAVA